MSVAQVELGGHFVIGLRPTADLHPLDRQLLADIRPSGVVVFRGNFLSDAPYEAWHAQFARLVAAVREAVDRPDVLICIDHEGGTVLRPPRPVTPFAAARSWADRAELVGRAMGVELASLGINVNFAPVVDIDSNPANPVIGPRAFGTSAEEVAGTGRAFAAGLESAGVRACAKHYPGHGDTSADSHHTLPVVGAPLPELLVRELKPFRMLVAAAVPLMMTAHVHYPALDPYEPATTSAILVQGLLRGQFGYQGVVISDDLGMRAVSERFERPGACADLLNAGTDLILVCSHWTDTERVRWMLADLQAAERSGALDHGALEASWNRIEALRRSTPAHTPRLLPAETFRAHAALAPLASRGGRAGQTVSLDEE